MIIPDKTAMKDITSIIAQIAKNTPKAVIIIFRMVFAMLVKLPLLAPKKSPILLVSFSDSSLILSKSIGLPFIFKKSVVVCALGILIQRIT